MRKLLLLLLVVTVTGAGACRTRKTGCPTPRQNWGAEKVLDEMAGKSRKRH
jgi:hypothetical protein